MDLQHSNSHQSYYTCLSHCASANGTLIMQSLQPSVITGGCSGWLRQEFCDLEILDEITKLAFHSKLVPGIDGHCRNTLIRQFRTWKDLHYVPENLHPSIKWSTQQPYPLVAEMQDIQWQIVDRNKKLNSNLKSQRSGSWLSKSKWASDKNMLTFWVICMSQTMDKYPELLYEKQKCKTLCLIQLG